MAVGDGGSEGVVLERRVVRGITRFVASWDCGRVGKGWDASAVCLIRVRHGLQSRKGKCETS